MNTLGIALCYGVSPTNIWLRDVDRVEAAAREALRFAAEMSLALWQAWARMHLGWALAERGAPEALAELEAGLDELTRIGARRLEAFHLGLTADLRSRAGQHSLGIARQQGARSLELRAARDLAGLWAEQGERQKAHDLLAPVYDWFTEGFESADLKDAKALLDELA